MAKAPTLIELLSLLVAEVIGIWMLWCAMPDLRGALLAWVFAVACGGLGSRLAAMVRERASESAKGG